MRNAFFFFVLISILIFFGCSDQRIVFKGEVHRGEITYQYRISVWILAHGLVVM